MSIVSTDLRLSRTWIQVAKFTYHILPFLFQRDMSLFTIATAHHRA